MTTPHTRGAADLPEVRLFTKKPVTIAAIQWTGKNLREVITFTDGPPDARTTHAGMAWEAYTDLVARDGLKIYTLEGKMLASPGDWIIRGVKGEFYPCKNDIFEATYSPAALAAGQATAAQAVVPAEWPTNGMIDAGRKAAASQGRLLGSCQSLWHVFRAMLAAAPAQPAAEASRFGSPELQAMIIARCVEKDQADSVTAPAPPPECETEAEKRAFAFGWFKALESERMKADNKKKDPL